MSQILAEVNAGANAALDVIVRTLELTCDAWAAPKSVLWKLHEELAQLMLNELRWCIGP